MENLLITGGAGYIGSHTVVELLNANFNVIVVDDLSNSSIKVIENIKKITQKESNLFFYNIDLKNTNQLDEIFRVYKVDLVIHFAGYKSVGESMNNPLKYYENNLVSTINLLKLMDKHEVYKFVFSSSATVYSPDEKSPLSEDSALKAINPYGRTKQFIEKILEDISNSNKKWKIICLRYFNPLGAHESGELGEDPKGIPNNLAPYITQVATGKLPALNIFGNDYNTPDGSCIRDYIHVKDLAMGHYLAVSTLLKNNNILCEYINLGSGRGYSVFEVLSCFEKVIGKTIPFKVIDRRDGDNEISIADIKKANEILGWNPKYDLEKMCLDTWHWQEKYPNGFE